MQSHIQIKWFEHRGKNCYGFVFAYNSEITRMVKAAGGVWSKSHICWYIIANDKLLLKLTKQLENTFGLEIELDEIVARQRAALFLDSQTEIYLAQLISWMQSKRYSTSTITSYQEALRVFFKFFNTKHVHEITADDVIRFNNEYILHRNLSHAYQNQFVNALKLFYCQILDTQMEVHLIMRPKTQRTLPNVLSKEEVKQILSVHTNYKHKAMLSLIYSCGLRCGELLRLKFEHIDSKRKVLIIKQSKGRKDRIAPLSEKIIELLRQYYLAFKPRGYLFEGNKPGMPYDVRSLQQVLKQAIKKAGINKPVSLHWLRHSYATHLLENGTDLRYIQEILGHSSSKTTEIYTHVSNKDIQKITSPYDYL
jgi:integrase/recombinase XerD